MKVSQHAKFFQLRYGAAANRGTYVAALQTSFEKEQEERMKLETLRDLYVEQLQDLYSAETQLVKALPKMAKAASNPQLQSAFKEHLTQTEQHVQRLEQIFNQLNTKPGKQTCKGMEGLISEGEEMIKMKGDSAAIDAGLIAAAQRVEHYEIAGYGCVRTYAQQLGDQQGARLLQQTLDEEGQTDHKLTKLAEQVINLEAER
jgi:ferritin-like metal-binding protein YciE